MLTWLDGRNGSFFGSIAWNGTVLSFTISAGQGANGLQAMVPLAPGGSVAGVTRNGSTVSYTVKQVKGISYAIFPGSSGSYEVNLAADVTPPTVIDNTPPDGAVDVNTVATVTISFSEPMDEGTIGTGTFELRDAASDLISSAITYNSGTNTATLTPTALLNPEAFYTATVDGVTDLAGNPLATANSWSFTTAASPTGCTINCSIWPSTAIPGIVDAGPTSPLELGVKFKADVSGTINGIRFYKASANTGTHVGNLWTAGGTLLASVTFTNETASGWQEMALPIPVAITADTIYVASYHTNVGHYGIDEYYFATAGMDTPPLHALADGVSGGNGVYAYSSTSTFPDQSWHASNGWVDVVFQQ